MVKLRRIRSVKRPGRRLYRLVKKMHQLFCKESLLKELNRTLTTSALGGEKGKELDQVSEDGLQESDTVLLMLKPSTDSKDVTLGLMELRWNPDTLTCIMPLSNFWIKVTKGSRMNTFIHFW